MENHKQQEATNSWINKVWDTNLTRIKHPNPLGTFANVSQRLVFMQNE